MYESRIMNERTDRLVDALLKLETREECYRLLEDLFTIREIEDLSQRIQVAELLSEKATYAEITQKTGASSATIGRVNPRADLWRGRIPNDSRPAERHGGYE